MDCDEPFQAEVMLMEAAYGDKCEVVSSSPISGAVFIIRLEQLDTAVRFTVPPDYPSNPIRFCIVEGKLRNSQRSTLTESIQSTIDDRPDIGTMEVCDVITELLITTAEEIAQQEHQQQAAAREGDDADVSWDSVLHGHGALDPTAFSIARFLIYFHHIRRYGQEQH